MRKTWKWLSGMALIAGGIIISYVLSTAVIMGEFFMFNPDNTGRLQGAIVGVPALVYGLIYTIWYWTHAKKKTRNQSAFHKSWIVFLITAVVDIGVLWFWIQSQGFMDEALGHIFVNWLLTSLSFVVSMTRFRPY